LNNTLAIKGGDIEYYELDFALMTNTFEILESKLEFAFSRYFHCHVIVINFFAMVNFVLATFTFVPFEYIFQVEHGI